MGSFRFLVERQRADPIAAEVLSVANSAIRLRALRFSPLLPTRSLRTIMKTSGSGLPGGSAFAVRFLLGGPHVRFRRVQTLVREGSPLVKQRNSA
jgi:hypothetical protein